MDDNLNITFPDGFVDSLQRRHNGASHTPDQIDTCYSYLKDIYKKYKRNRDRETWLLNVFWDKDRIEEHFGERKWYNAHRRLRRCQDNIKKFHAKMFYILTAFDGNGDQYYDPLSVINPDDIMWDFEEKYLNGCH